MADAMEAKIAARANELWEREGRPEGRAGEHWEQARREIESETASAGAAPKITPYNDPTRPGGPVEGGSYPDAPAAAKPKTTP